MEVSRSAPITFSSDILFSYMRPFFFVNYDDTTAARKLEILFRMGRLTSQTSLLGEVMSMVN